MESIDIITKEFLKGFYVIYIVMGVAILLLLVGIIIAKVRTKSPKTQNISSSHYGQTCPQCGGKLLRKNGKYGAFVGCSSYPRCNHTASIN